jgi:hypothetical protein
MFTVSPRVGKWEQISSLQRKMLIKAQHGLFTSEQENKNQRFSQNSHLGCVIL